MNLIHMLLRQAPRRRHDSFRELNQHLLRDIGLDRGIADLMFGDRNIARLQDRRR